MMTMSATTRMWFDLSISYDEFEKVYRGQVHQIFTYSLDGRSIKFPAGILRPFLTHDGVQGRFCLIFDKNHKFVDIERAS
jgi:hypothetical protein